jgi:hypothetical protein
MAIGGLLAASILLGRAAHAEDPTTADCLAASEKSIELRSKHRLRDARQKLLTCSQPACPNDIKQECLRRIPLVNQEIPTVVFDVVDADGQHLTAVRVLMDGAEVVAERLQGIAVSLDPGSHTFTFAVEGKPPTVIEQDILEGQKLQRLHIVLGPRGVTRAPGGPAPRSPERPPATEAPPHAPESPAPGAATAPPETTAPASTRAETTVPAPRNAIVEPVAAVPPPRNAIVEPVAAVHPPPAAAPTAAAPQAPPVSPTDPTAPTSTRKRIGMAAVAVGVVLIGGGAWAWKSADGRYDEIRAACDHGCSAAERASGVSEVQSRDHLAAAGFLVGGALVAAGAAALVLGETNEGAGKRLSFGASTSARALFLRGEF